MYVLHIVERGRYTITLFTLLLTNQVHGSKRGKLLPYRIEINSEWENYYKIEKDTWI